MTDLPAPPVPADCDLRDMDGFMLNAERLLASELWALSDGASFKAAVALWCRAWKQIPAASLPDDDDVIAAFAGVTVPMLRKNRTIILRGFIKCSDGRLYHKTLAEDAARSMAAKQRRKEAKEAEAERLRKYREQKKNTEQNGDRTGGRTPYEQGTYGTRQDRTGTGQGQDRDRTGLKVAATALREAAHAASGMLPLPPDQKSDFLETDPADQPTIQEHQTRTLGDWHYTIGKRAYLHRDERDAWERMFADAGWDIMTEAYTAILPKIKDPKHKVQLAMMVTWIDAHYQEATP